MKLGVPYFQTNPHMIFSEPNCYNRWRKMDSAGRLFFLSGYDVLGNGQPTGQAEVVTHLCTKHC